MGRRPAKVVVVGIDPSTDLGWAIALVEGGKATLRSSGAFSMKPFKTFGEALCELENLLLGLLVNWACPVIVVDEVIQFQMAGGVKVGQMYGRIVGEIERICHKHGIKIDHIVPSRARKYAVGKGNAKKPEVRDVLEKKFCCEFSAGDGKCGKRNYDQSDAVAIAIGYINYNGLATG